MELPPAKSKPRSLPPDLDGRVLLVQLHELDSSKKAILDFTTWAQCFALYSAAVLQRQPDRAGDLMAYFFFTAGNARKYRWPSWVVYDQNFRQLMAGTQDMVWAKTDPGFFTQCFIHTQKAQDSWCSHCHPTEHTGTGCPYSPSTSRPNPAETSSPEHKYEKKGAICRDFNNPKGKGCRWGANCYRKHTCSDCRGAHWRFKCPTKMTGPPQHLTGTSNTNSES